MKEFAFYSFSIQVNLEFLFPLFKVDNLIGTCSRASLGWFAYEPEWHDINSTNFAQSEAQSVALFVQYLSISLKDGSQIDVKGQVRENGSSVDPVRWLYLQWKLFC